MALPASGTLAYNGVTFSSLFRSKISGTPEYDEARRSVKWVRWTLDVDGYVTDPDSTDDTLDDYRKRLTTPGQRLQYEDKGFGSFDVNSGAVRDAAWGPHPEVLSWDPVGDRRAAVLSWKVTTCIPECVNAKFEGIAALNYEASFEVDKDGYTTRTITGHLIIAQTRDGGGRRVKETADKYRARVIPAPLEGFQRTQSYKVGKDKNRLDWTITDRQLPVPLPAGATGVEISHEVASQFGNGKAFLNWDVRFSGSITLPPTKARASAWDVMFLVVTSRLKKAGADYTKRYRLMAASFSEQVFGLQALSFTLTYLLLASSLSKILKESGLWQPIDGTSHAKWRDSLLDSALHDRGAARLGLRDGEEAIVDLCIGQESTLRAQGLPKGGRAELRAAGGLTSPTVLTRASWVRYDNVLTIKVVNRVSRHKRLADDPVRVRVPTGTDAVLSTAARLQALPGLGVPALIESRSEPDLVQENGSPEYEIEMVGRAERVGLPIPVPRLVSVAGVEVIQRDVEASAGVKGSVGGLPWRVASWRVRYILPEAFRGRLPDVANPIYGTDGGVNA